MREKAKECHMVEDLDSKCAPLELEEATLQNLKNLKTLNRLKIDSKWTSNRDTRIRSLLVTGQKIGERMRFQAKVRRSPHQRPGKWKKSELQNAPSRGNSSFECSLSAKQCFSSKFFNSNILTAAAYDRLMIASFARNLALLLLVVPC